MHPKFAARLDEIANNKLPGSVCDLRDMMEVVKRSVDNIPYAFEFFNGLLDLPDTWLRIIELKYNKDEIELKYHKPVITNIDDDISPVIFKVNIVKHTPFKLTTIPDDSLFIKFFNSEEFAEGDDATLTLPILCYLRAALNMSDKNIEGNFLEGDIRKFRLVLEDEFHDVEINLGEIYWFSSFLKNN